MSQDNGRNCIQVEDKKAASMKNHGVLLTYFIMAINKIPFSQFLLLCVFDCTTDTDNVSSRYNNQPLGVCDVRMETQWKRRALLDVSVYMLKRVLC